MRTWLLSWIIPATITSNPMALVYSAHDAYCFFKPVVSLLKGADIIAAAVPEPAATASACDTFNL